MPPQRTNKILIDHGEWLEVDVSTSRHPDAIMKINKADWRKVLAYGYGRNLCVELASIRYVVCAMPQEHGKQIKRLVHRLILSGSECVDHINHDGLDNRRSNLRSCRISDNNKNRRIAKNNKSGVTGVYFAKSNNKWAVQIPVNGKQKHLGTFSSLEDAVAVRKKAELELYGEFANVQPSDERK